jgi:phospholipase/lecithinase/hemolysin
MAHGVPNQDTKNLQRRFTFGGSWARKLLVKSLIPFTLAVLLLCLLAPSSSAAFTNIYVFGDTLSATTNIVGKTNAPGGQYFYGQRWSNGRVWVEALAQMQGMTFRHANNNSYYDHNSTLLANEVTGFSATDATNSLFVVWVCNADTFDVASITPPPNTTYWNNQIAIFTNNHIKIITNLYSKGARALVLPNAVDISKIPAFNRGDTAGMSSGCVAYNAAFSNMVNRVRILCPNLKIYTPDFFSLLNSVIANAQVYGLTNVLDNGFSIDAFNDPNLDPLSISNGPGTNYIFWDDKNPTAKLHFTMAGVANALLSPPVITSITPTNGSNRLDLASLPVATSKATNCFVLFATNLNQIVWQTNLPGFSSTNTTQSVTVPAGGPQRFYRLRSNLAFPWPWVWP